MTWLLYIAVPLAALVLFLAVCYFLSSSSMTVNKGSHWPRVRDWYKLFRNAWFTGPIEYEFTVTQAMVDAVHWAKEGCTGDVSKIIGRGSGFRLPRNGSVRGGWRYASSEVMTDAALALLEEGESTYVRSEGIELWAMGHSTEKDPETGWGRMIFESLGTAKVGDEVRIMMQSQKGKTSLLVVGKVQPAAWLPIDTRWGLPLGLYLGGNCPALNRVTV